MPNHCKNRPASQIFWISPQNLHHCIHIISIIKWINLHSSSIVIGGVSLFGHAIHSSADTYWKQCRNKYYCRINTFSTNFARVVEFGSLDVRDDGEYSGVVLVEISDIFVTQDDFVYGVASFDKVYDEYLTCIYMTLTTFITSTVIDHCILLMSDNRTWKWAEFNMILSVTQCHCQGSH